MVNISDFAKRIRQRSWTAGILFFGGATLMLLDFRSKLPVSVKGELALIWLLIMGIGVYFWYRSLELPMKEIMQLAEEHQGLLTVTEISTALAVNPDLVLRTLRELQKRGLARVSFQSLDKNLWEFPDCTQLPITQALQIAQQNGGFLTVGDLIAAGVSLELAHQTITVLRAKGVITDAESKLDLPDPGGTSPRPSAGKDGESKLAT